MSEKQKDLTKKVILYLIEKLGTKTEGRKKLMKLMFLIDHYDTESNKISKESFLGNEYLIYYYGVFSFDVMKSYSELVTEKKIKDSFPVTTNISGVELPKGISEKVDKIIQVFGEKDGYELELITLNMLGIKPSEKEKFFGKTISEILK